MPGPQPPARTFPLLAAQTSGSLRPFRNMRSALGNEAAWLGARQLQRCCLLASGPMDLPAKWLPGQEVQWCFEAGRLVRRLWVHQGLLQWWGTVSISLQPGSRESGDRPLGLHSAQSSSWAARSSLGLVQSLGDLDFLWLGSRPPPSCMDTVAGTGVRQGHPHPLVMIQFEPLIYYGVSSRRWVLLLICQVFGSLGVNLLIPKPLLPLAGQPWLPLQKPQ